MKISTFRFPLLCLVMTIAIAFGASPSALAQTPTPLPFRPAPMTCQAALNRASRPNLAADVFTFVRLSGSCSVILKDQSGQDIEFHLGLPVDTLLDVLTGQPVSAWTKASVEYEIESGAITRIWPLTPNNQPTPTPTPAPTGPVPTSLQLGPAPIDMLIGNTYSLPFSVLDAASQVIPGQSVSFTVSPSNIATVDSSGLVTPLVVGDAVVTAQVAGSFVNAKLDLKVTGEVPRVTQIQLTPDSLAIRMGDTALVSAMVLDQYKREVVGAQPVFEILSGILLTAPCVSIDTNGLVTPLEVGTCLIGASFTTTTGAIVRQSSALSVTITQAAPVANTVNIPGQDLTLQVGQQLDITPVVNDQYGNPMPNVAVGFTVTPLEGVNALVVNRPGAAVTGVRVGKATLSAYLVDKPSVISPQVITITIDPETRSSWNPAGPANLSGILQAEDFDRGANFVAYRDISPGNLGLGYRPYVEADLTINSAGKVILYSTRAGEFLEYTVNVPVAGPYQGSVTLANAPTNAGSVFHFELNATDITGPITAPTTLSWSDFRTVSFVTASLPAGLHTLRLMLDLGGANNVVANFDSFEFAPWPSQIQASVASSVLVVGEPLVWNATEFYDAAGNLMTPEGFKPVYFSYNPRILSVDPDTGAGVAVSPGYVSLQLQLGAVKSRSVRVLVK